MWNNNICKKHQTNVKLFCFTCGQVSGGTGRGGAVKGGPLVDQTSVLQPEHGCAKVHSVLTTAGRRHPTRCCLKQSSGGTPETRIQQCEYSGTHCRHAEVVSVSEVRPWLTHTRLRQCVKSGYIYLLYIHIHTHFFIFFWGGSLFIYSGLDFGESFVILQSPMEKIKFKEQCQTLTCLSHAERKEHNQSPQSDAGHLPNCSIYVTLSYLQLFFLVFFS